MKTGDTVKHHPSDENWTVAYVTDSRYLGWCGWPSGDVPATECSVIEECSFQEHVDLLKQIAKGGYSGYADKRPRMAWLRLHDIARASTPTGGKRDNYDKLWKASEDSNVEIGRLQGLLSAETERKQRIDAQLREACLEVVDQVAAARLRLAFETNQSSPQQ